MRITIIPKKVVVFLLAGVAVLVLLHTLSYAMYYMAPYGDIGGLLPKFDLDAELSVPTWYAQMLLAIAAGLLLLIGIHKRKEQAPYAIHWLLLGGIFMYISVDEGAALHELSIEPIRNIFGITGGILYHAWIIPAVVIMIILTMLYLRFFLSLPKNIRYLFVVSACVYIGGALGVEMAGGYYLSTYGDGVGYTIIVTVEEVMEKVGVIIFIGALLLYIRDHIRDVQVKVVS